MIQHLLPKNIYNIYIYGIMNEKIEARKMLIDDKLRVLSNRDQFMVYNIFNV